jgi:hypothetical protein
VTGLTRCPCDRSPNLRRTILPRLFALLKDADPDTSTLKEAKGAVHESAIMRKQSCRHVPYASTNRQFTKLYRTTHAGEGAISLDRLESRDFRGPNEGGTSPPAFNPECNLEGSPRASASLLTKNYSPVTPLLTRSLRSTLRFSARPSAVSFDAAGFVSPIAPGATMFFAGTWQSWSKYATTA